MDRKLSCRQFIKLQARNGLLLLTGISGISIMAPNIFLQMDPTLVLISGISARIFRQKCLAWEFEKAAWFVMRSAPMMPLSFIWNQAAIVVPPMDALRMNQGSYETNARLKGFDLRLKPLDHRVLTKESYPGMDQGPAPGFDE